MSKELNGEHEFRSTNKKHWGNLKFLETLEKLVAAGFTDEEIQQLIDEGKI